MSGYTELIKSFEKIRNFARDFYIYGYKGRGDYNNVSPRSYDNERRRIESYLSEHIVKNRDNKGKTLSISSNTVAKTSNPLFKVWQTKSFTKNDCFLHFVILDILSDKGSLCVSEITKEITINYTSGLEETEPIDTMTIRNKLNEYTRLGILSAEKSGKTLYYSLSCNPLCCLNPYTLESLNTALSYYKNVMPLGFLAHSINNTTDSPFIYRQIFFAQILDSEILLDIFKAISDKKIIKLDIISSKHYRRSKTSVIPLKVLSNTKTGRQYIAVYSVNKNKFSTVRLDYIDDITFCDIYPEYDSVKAEYELRLKNSFSIIHQTLERQHYIRMLLNIDENTETYVIERLKREGRHGTVTKVCPNVFEYYIEVPDTLEIVPWLRTFIGRIIKIEGSESKVISLFKRDINTMASMYK